jgi:glycosyltransferase involved in cell wall biosynthesis
VRFAGNVSQGDVARWFAAADVVAIPSVRDDSGNVDGLPNTVLEALASGTPVVATSAGGIGSVVLDGETGVIVPERDAPALASAIRALLQDRERRDRLGRAGRAAVESRHGWDAAAAAFEAAYDRALAFKSLTR